MLRGVQFAIERGQLDTSEARARPKAYIAAQKKVRVAFIVCADVAVQSNQGVPQLLEDHDSVVRVVCYRIVLECQVQQTWTALQTVRKLFYQIFMQVEDLQALEMAEDITAGQQLDLIETEVKFSE